MKNQKPLFRNLNLTKRQEEITVCRPLDRQRRVRPLDRSLARSITRSLARSIARSLDRSIARSIARSLGNREKSSNREDDVVAG